MKYREFWKGNYSFSLVRIDRNKEIVPVAVLHQENIDPCLLVKSWLDQQSCNPVKDVKWTGNNMQVSWKGHEFSISPFEDRTDDIEQVVAINCNGRFCLVNYTEFLFATDGLLSTYALAPELKLSEDKNGKWEPQIYKVELDKETPGVAIDPNTVFSVVELLSSTLFDDPHGRCYALALHKPASDLHEPERHIPIESVLYGNTYRSFYNDGNYTDNPYYCFNATVDESDFSLLPDIIFVKILLNVPWRQRILSRRVNKRWMKLCNVAVSIDTKTIHQGGQQFHGMDTDDLWRLLPIVSNCLEEIEWMELCGSQRPLEILQQIPVFQNLRIIDVAGGEPDYVTFFSLLDKCPNLCELTAVVPTASSTDYSPGTFQVKKLTLPNRWLVQVNDYESYLMECFDHFPSIIDLCCPYSFPSPAGFSVVIGKYGENLVHLEMHCASQLESNAAITGMEKCHNLEHLVLIGCDFLSDACLKDMATGCQKLRTLDITLCGNVTSGGLAALAALPNLRQLNVSLLREDLSLGISQIAKQGRLEQLVAQYVHLSVACVKDCVRYCRQLKLLDNSYDMVMDDDQIELEEAKEIIYLFNDWSLSRRLLFRTRDKVWTNSEIKQLREEQKKSGQHLFVVHYAWHVHDDYFIRDDQSIASHESFDSQEGCYGYQSDGEFAPDEVEYTDYNPNDYYDHDDFVASGSNDPN